MASEGSKKPDVPQRHCSFCLKLLPYKLCGGCRRRAYCSAQCQREDWSPTGKGQGHKNWCKLEHGQEDIDWEVQPVPGKGLGIIAKRFIPSMYKIIVEGLYYEPNSHPAIADLSPEGGTLREKFDCNSFRGDEYVQQGRSCVSLRVSRVNHSCSPNAGYTCETDKVGILYSNRDIQPGEEICICYKGFEDVHEYGHFSGTSVDSEFLAMKAVLRLKWGIICPSSSRCNDESFRQNVLKLKKLNGEFETCKGSNPSRAIKITNEIIPIMKMLDFSWPSQAAVHARPIFLEHRHRSVTLEALDHLKKAHQIYSTLLPFSILAKNTGNNLLKQRKRQQLR